ncbi:MAG: KH domain-containing protein [bacterium]|nr:KH domain-containing protein [bacterium]
MAERFADQEFVEYVVKSIVDHADDVKAERTIDEMGVLITLSVNPEDMGQIIGRQGQTAKSIRTLLRVIGAKNDARVNLKVLEPEGGKRSREMRGPRRDDRDMGMGASSMGGDSQMGAPMGDAMQGPMDQDMGSQDQSDKGMPEAKPESNPMDDLKI